MKTALVTGASRGIGAGIAKFLASQGYGLTITSRAETDLEALSHELLRLGAPKVVHRPADLAIRADLPSLIDLHGRTFGSMNALIVNAGVGTAGKVASYRIERLDKTLEVNFSSALILVNAALPLLRAAAAADSSRASRVIALASITGVYAEAGLAVYGATKAALVSLMESLNLEESENGVCATAIAPGYVDTDMSAWATDTVPAETMIRVDDVVSVVEMLLKLGRTASITKIAMTRSGASTYGA